ncbi:MAG: hypothetical protein JSS30_05590 [Verrucomicrobia bacterium]|nr:hypothetical protein [Verrucomicrobiota bacterium]
MIEIIQLTNSIEVAHIGPPLSEGRKAAAFYFSISGEDSLGLDPFNQPAVFLSNKGVRVFSMNLPAHGPNFNALEAIELWARDFSEGKDPLTPFIDQVVFALTALIDRGLIYAEKVGLMGLSRGGLIACLVAEKFPDVRGIVSFAPMITLSAAKEFKDLTTDAKVQQFNLENHIQALCEQKIRFYIGNRDIRVGTDRCFRLIELLTEAAFQNGLRSPPIELIISPSIGHMGHGTPKEIFQDGALWLAKQLGAIR